MYKVGVLTASDKGAAGQREDISASVIKQIIAEVGWEISCYRLVPDEFDIIVDNLVYMSDDKKVDLILTTGGTGFSPRDITPEATKAVIDRDVPGIPEVMRAISLRYTPRAMLSRAVAGIRNSTLIINLPGSQKAVKECLEAIMDSLPHGLEMLSGKAGECGNSAE